MTVVRLTDLNEGLKRALPMMALGPEIAPMPVLAIGGDCSVVVRWHGYWYTFAAHAACTTPGFLLRGTL